MTSRIVSIYTSTGDERDESERVQQRPLHIEKADAILDVIFATATGTANQGKIGSGDLLDLQIPFPPLAEQKRIVAKVDELMALCDELEVRLTTTATTRHQLLETTLREALNYYSGV